MRLALVPWTTRQHPALGTVARPDVGDQAYQAIDLREFGVDRALVYLPDQIGSVSGGRLDLGEDGTLNASLRNALGNRLGVTVDTTDTLGTAILKVIGGRLRATVAGLHEIRVGPRLLYQAAAIRGGATDAFTYSNGALATVSSGAWTQINGTNSVTSNAVKATSTGSECTSVYGTAIAADAYAQAVITNGGAGYREGGVIGRKAAANTTSSFYLATLGSDSRIYLYSAASGSFSEIASSVAVGTVDGAVKLECNGSTIKAFHNGTERISTTHTTHTGSFYGIEQYNEQASATTLDDWEAASLSGAATRRVDRVIRPRGAFINSNFY